MNPNFRLRSPRPRPRQALDGILNAPVRRQLDTRQLGRRNLVGMGRDRLRTSTRTIGDFVRPEGYHPANTQIGSTISGVGRRPQSSSQGRSDAAASKTTASDSHHAAAKKVPAVTKRQAKSKWDWPKIRKWSLRGGLAVLGVLVLLGGFLFVKGFFQINKVFKGGGSAAALDANVNPSRLKGEGDGRVNILLVGRGGEGHAGADLTDTILLASIDPVNKKAALLSIPRDLWVTTERGSSKINAVYANYKNSALSRGSSKDKAEAAGMQALEDVLKDVLGISIHYYGMVDFQAFKQAVDTVGGVDMYVPPELAVTEKMWDPTTHKNYYLNVPAGQQHFDGTRALFFTRSRHTSPRGDFDRAERQRLFLKALSKKVLSLGTLSNPVKISQLLDTFGEHVSTDLSISDASRLVDIGKDIGDNIESISLVDPPNNFLTTGMIDGQSIVKPTAGLGEYSAIQEFVRSKLKDGYIVKENAQITVLNGTTKTGLAAESAQELRTYGYNVGVVADAPTQTYEKTIIVDLTKGKKPYTKNYLERRFGVKATTTLPDQAIQLGNASFVIILGRNETINR